MSKQWDQWAPLLLRLALFDEACTWMQSNQDFHVG